MDSHHRRTCRWYIKNLIEGTFSFYFKFSVYTFVICASRIKHDVRIDIKNRQMICQVLCPFPGIFAGATFSHSQHEGRLLIFHGTTLLLTSGSCTLPHTLCRKNLLGNSVMCSFGGPGAILTKLKWVCSASYFGGIELVF